MIIKKAANSSSELKYSCPIYLPNHLREVARTCSSYLFSLVLIYSVYLHKHRQDLKSKPAYAHICTTPPSLPHREDSSSSYQSPQFQWKNVCGGRVGGERVMSRSRDLTLSADDFYLHSLALP